MAKISAGLLMYRRVGGRLEVLLVHPGGPLWKKRDEGAWSIPKGEPNAGEELLAAAVREFTEETGLRSSGPFFILTPATQKGGKVIHAWAFAGDCDPTSIKSNTFAMEWPPRSGRKVEFAEIDRAGFFSMEEAAGKMNPAQAAWLEELPVSV